MIANHIHDALAQIHKLREMILAKKKFRGYSGNARILSGTTALIAAAILASDLVPDDPYLHLIGWGCVLFIGVVLNYAALLYWFLFDRDVRRNPIMLKPAMDALPALGVGAVLTLAIIYSGQYYLMHGIWMCLYGLAQMAYRLALPIGIYFVGVLYILCGTYYLLVVPVSFLNPWPMGIVFFAGELAGGVILLMDRKEQNNERENDNETEQ